MIAFGSSAAVLLIVPTVAIGLNWYMTGAGMQCDKRACSDVVLRCIFFGALAYFVSSIGTILLSCYPVAKVTQFSLVPLALAYFTIFGFFGMTAFGAMYYIIPRATRMAWPSEKLVRLHYTCSAAGIGILSLSLLIGGLIQGYRLNLTAVDVVRVTRGAIPFIGLATLGFLVLLVGQIAFLKNLVTLLHRQAAPVRRAAVDLFIPETARAGGKP
jgi:cytochrome c oxidase cbb3-type subunit 1